MKKVAILINPPVYDTQYWARWSLPHGLLKIATYLKKVGYETILYDCMYSHNRNTVHKKLISVVDLCSTNEYFPSKWSNVKLKDNQKIKYCFGKSPTSLGKELYKLANKQLSIFDQTKQNIQYEVWISSIMTYWWESTRDIIKECYKAIPGVKIRVGGIYPTLTPEHAEKNLCMNNPYIINGSDLDLDNSKIMEKDLIVVGEVPEASNLDLDLSLYNDDENPKYSILTSSRGCPHNCSYCASKIINNGSKVRFRPYEQVVKEIEDKYWNSGIKEFCFYEDNLLAAKENFSKILFEINQKPDLKVKLHAPEGVELKLVLKDYWDSQKNNSTNIIKLMKTVGFDKIYLPLETIKQDMNEKWNRGFSDIQKFEQVLKICEEAGFTLRNQDINVFILFGLPEERLQDIIDTAIYASHKVGSIIPMLFTPVPGTKIFNDYADYIKHKNFDLQHLNGKLFPFFDLNKTIDSRITFDDYIRLESLMMRLNTKVKSQSFDISGDNPVPVLFRKILYEISMNNLK